MKTVTPCIMFTLLQFVLFSCVSVHKIEEGQLPASVEEPVCAMADGEGEAWPSYWVHKWAPLFEDDLYAQPETLLYTYILFNQNTPSLLDRGRLSKISHLLYLLTEMNSQFSESKDSNVATNIFFIPCSDYMGGHTSTSRYSAPVSRMVRDKIIETYLNHESFSELKNDLDGIGPYLVTSTEKLSEMTVSSPLLYIDLSRIEYQAYPKIVDVYKDYLEEECPTNISEVNSLKKYFWATFFGLPVLFPQIKESVIVLK